MDGHFVHETCWNDVLFLGLKLTGPCFVECEHQKTLTVAAEYYL